MESLDLIRDMCLKALSGFHSVVEEQHNKKVSTRYLLIPHFIRNDKDESHSSCYPNVRRKYLFWLKYFSILPFSKKMNVDGLARLIYDNQMDISWVDFMFLSAEKNLTVYIVELVCLGKKEGSKLNYHIAMPIDNYFGR